MKILNLYAGIGGNRKLWCDDHEIIAVENNESIAKVYSDYFPKDRVIIDDAHNYLLDHYQEYDFIWSSPPCQSHSRARFWGSVNRKKYNPIYPDIKLYEEILFLKHYFKGKWVVENVVSFYKPLIKPSIKIGRHLFWSNFEIRSNNDLSFNINREEMIKIIKLRWFNLSNFTINSGKYQIYRNCVNPRLGLHILDCSYY